MQTFIAVFLSFAIAFTALTGFAEASTIGYPAFSSTPPMAIFSFAGKRPENLGAKDGKLLPCPNSPNCVSSQSLDLEHGISPLAYKSDPQTAIADLKFVLQRLERAQIITETEEYIHAEFTSALMGFVDDVEFYLNRDKGVIEVRSASRLGQSDLGVNRKRIETIRAELQKKQTGIA